MQISGTAASLSRFCRRASRSRFSGANTDGAANALFAKIGGGFGKGWAAAIGSARGRNARQHLGRGGLRRKIIEPRHRHPLFRIPRRKYIRSAGPGSPPRE